MILREVRTGRAHRVFPVAKLKEPAVLAMTPEGRRIAAASTDRVLAWDTVNGEPSGEAQVGASALAFSPDGALLAAGEGNGTTRVYRVPGLEEVAALPSPSVQSRITCLAFGRDPVIRAHAARATNSWLLATGEQGGGIVIWDVSRGLPRSFCRGSTWTIGGLAFDPDGLTLASVGRNEPRLWDVPTGQCLLVLEELSKGLGRAVAFDSGGRRLICGGEADGGVARVALSELEVSRGIQALRGLSCAARKVWFSRDNRRLAALSDDWHLGCWDLSRQRLLFVFETPKGVYADSAGACFDTNATRLAFATGRQACLYDLETGASLRQWQLEDGLADELEFDARGRLLLLRRERPAETSEEECRVWRLYELGESPEGTPLFEQVETNMFARQMLFQPGGALFAVWYGGGKGTNRTVHVYDVDDGREVWGEATKVFDDELRMCVDPTGQRLGYTFDQSRRLQIVRFDNNRELRQITGDACKAISPSGEEFASTLDPSRLWWRRNGTEQSIPLTTEYGALSWVSAFSADGRLLAWGTSEGVVCVADIAEVKKRLATLRVTRTD